MKATLLLANSAQADPTTGTIHALSAGWSATGSPTQPISLLLIVDCPWDQTNVPHNLTIELCDADGRVVMFPGPDGDMQPAANAQAQFEVGRPPGMPAGTPIRQCMVLDVAPGLPLQPGEKYEFRLTIDGEPMDSWLSTFTVRAQ